MTIAPHYAVRVAYPHYVDVGREQLAQLPVYVGAELAEVSSGTFALYDQSGTLMQAPAVTVVGLIPRVTLAALPSTQARGYGYRAEWTLVMADGSTPPPFSRDVVVTLRAIYPVLTDQDLLSVYTDLDRLRPSKLASYESYRIEAWKRILGRLESQGNLPNLIVTPWSLREMHLELTLYLIAQDMRTGRDGKWAELAEHHKREFEFRWRSANWQYATDDSGDTGVDGQRQGAEAFLLSTAPPATSWGW